MYLRMIALVVGWSLTLSVSTYGLFAPRFLGYSQPQLSATFSAGAAVTILTQVLLFPRLARGLGEHATCAAGLWVYLSGIMGQALIRFQPFHTGLYLLNRIGSGIADTSTATLVAKSSPSREAKSRNLALVQSTRAAARIVTPILSGTLFERSCCWNVAPGALPYALVSPPPLSHLPLGRPHSPRASILAECGVRADRLTRTSFAAPAREESCRGGSCCVAPERYESLLRPHRVLRVLPRSMRVNAYL